VEEVFRSNIAQATKDALRAAQPYAEGRSVVLDVCKRQDVSDVRTLLDIKMRN
jgi:hypothetical protein